MENQIDWCRNKHNKLIVGTWKNRCRACRKETYQRWKAKHPSGNTEHSRKWRLANPVEARNLAREWARKNPHSGRRGVWKRYGIRITAQEYETRLREQNYCCAICKKHRSDLKRNLAVDHNHQTGQVRGLLCNYCNTILINALENAGHLIEDAKGYLNGRHQLV